MERTDAQSARPVRGPSTGRGETRRTRVVNGFFAYGEYDVVLILEMPDEASAAALAVAAAGGGALRSTNTTQLITAAEGVEILKKAASCGYKPVTAAAAATR